MNSSSSSSSLNPNPEPEVTLSLTLPPPSPFQPTKAQERGIKLIKLLLKCAKHSSSGNLHRADHCLQQISRLASVTGDPMQRLSAWFASAMAVRLVKRWPGVYKALNHEIPANEQMGQARAVLTGAFPYMGFAYAVITRTLIRTMSSERVIHIIDLGSSDPKLWGPFIQNLAHFQNGPPHLKITCVNTNKALLEKLGPMLLKESESLNMPFQFNPLNVPLKELTLDMLKVRSGEALAIISVLNLHILLAEDDQVDPHFKKTGVDGPKIMGQFLAMLRSMSPKLMLLVEQESNHNSIRLVDRVVEGLNYYSALFDSMDATFGESLWEDRIAVEERIGKEIENVVACEGLEREERHERYEQWSVRFGAMGFRPVRLWSEPMEEAERLSETYKLGGYKIISHRASLLICWHDRPIYAVSAWI